MDQLSAQKICRFCRSDVAGKPRIKDKKGRYACQPCFERVKATQSASRVATASTLKDSGEIGLEVEGGMIELEDSPKNEGGLFCPECGMAVERSSVLCVHCGYSPGEGKRLQTEIGKRAEIVDHSRGPISWENQIAVLAPMGAVLAYLVFKVGGRLMHRTDIASHINWTLVGNIAILAVVACYPIGCVWAATNDARRHHSAWWSVLVAICPPVTFVHVYARAENAALKLHMAISIAVAAGVTFMVLKGGIAG
ncbi:MAG: hypothetical protein ACNA8P_02800 [Phycisphaerales bacterium]